jgi:hypothetical protein
MEFVVLPPAMFLTIDEQQQQMGRSSSMIVVQR